uniref:Uncharacterized protein n=1 Tax=Arundo donax TaxID=35708 RepID=A0A0A9H6R1_ARUDO
MIECIESGRPEASAEAEF